MSREQKLVDILFECMMLSHDKNYTDHFSNMSREELAEWTATQLRNCGFDTQPCGMSWAVLK